MCIPTQEDLKKRTEDRKKEGIELPENAVSDMKSKGQVICKLPGSNPPPCLDLFSVVQSSTPQLHFFTACCELLSFLLVGILNKLFYLLYLFTVSPVSATVLYIFGT